MTHKILYSAYIFIFLFYSFFSPEIFSKTPLSSDNDYGYYLKHGKASKAWNDLVQKGFGAYDAQDCERALAFMKEAIAAGCTDPILLFKVGACSELMGSYYSAAQYYQQAEGGLKILSSPHRYQRDFYQAYGRALFLNKKLDEAAPYLTKAVGLGEANFTLFYLLGQLAIAKGDRPKALDYFGRATGQPLQDASPGQLAQVFSALAKSYFEIKDYDKALEFTETALKYSPGDPELTRMRSRINDFKRQEQIFKMFKE